MAHVFSAINITLSSLAGSLLFSICLSTLINVSYFLVILISLTITCCCCSAIIASIFGNLEIKNIELGCKNENIEDINNESFNVRNNDNTTNNNVNVVSTGDINSVVSTDNIHGSANDNMEVDNNPDSTKRKSRNIQFSIFTIIIYVLSIPTFIMEILLGTNLLVHMNEYYACTGYKTFDKFVDISNVECYDSYINMIDTYYIRDLSIAIITLIVIVFLVSIICDVFRHINIFKNLDIRIVYNRQNDTVKDKVLDNIYYNNSVNTINDDDTISNNDKDEFTDQYIDIVSE